MNKCSQQFGLSMWVENIFWDWIYYANPCGDDCNLTSFKIFSTVPLNSLPSSMLSFHVPLHGGKKVTFSSCRRCKTTEYTAFTNFGILRVFGIQVTSNHTSYLSFLGRHHIFRPAKSTQKNCLETKQRKFYFVYHTQCFSVFVCILGAWYFNWHIRFLVVVLSFLERNWYLKVSRLEKKVRYRR